MKQCPKKTGTTWTREQVCEIGHSPSADSNSEKKGSANILQSRLSGWDYLEYSPPVCLGGPDLWNRIEITPTEPGELMQHAYVLYCPLWMWGPGCKWNAINVYGERRTETQASISSRWHGGTWSRSGGLMSHRQCGWMWTRRKERVGTQGTYARFYNFHDFIWPPIVTHDWNERNNKTGMQTSMVHTNPE